MKNVKCVRLVLAIAAVFVLASLGWFVPLSKTSQAAPAPSSDTAFKGKLLIVHTNNMMTPGFLLEKVQLQKIGDHSFLVGKGVAEGGNVGWYKGRTVRVQMDHIVSITEFDNLKDLEKGAQTTIIGGGYAPVLPSTAPVPVEVPATPLPAPPVAPPPPKALPKQ